LVAQLRAWSGAQFQSITGLQLAGSEDIFFELHFYLGRVGGGARVLLLDLNRHSPQLWLLESDEEIEAWQACARIKRKRPMELFLRSHFVGQRLLNVESRGPGQLALSLCCEPEGLAELEFSLRPQAPQFRALRIKESRELQMTEFKPQDSNKRSSLRVSAKGQESFAPQSALSWDASLVEVHRERTSKFLQGLRPKTMEVHQAESRPRRSKRAVDAVRDEIAAKTLVPWRAWADHILQHGDQFGRIVPPSFASVETEMIWHREVDLARQHAMKPHELAARFFELAKKLERKLEGTRKRLAELERLAAEDAQGGGEQSARADSKRKPAVESSTNKPSLLQQAEARGRSLAIADDLVFYIGKSAEDNLRLLRRAQSFDYWFHVRGRTGAHGILRRARGRVVSEAELQFCARALVEQSLKKRAVDLRGESFDVSLCEVRFVKSVKGAKGLVHFTHDRTLRAKF
jgi:hypothetical protein